MPLEITIGSTTDILTVLRTFASARANDATFKPGDVVDLIDPTQVAAYRLGKPSDAEQPVGIVLYHDGLYNQIYVATVTFTGNELAIPCMPMQVRKRTS